MALIARVERWLFDPVPGVALVLARVVFGATLLLSYLSRLPDVPALYGPSGLPGGDPVQSLEPLPTPFQPLIAGINHVLPPVPAAVVWAAYVLLLVAAACFVLGYRTRTSGVLTLLLHLYFVRVRNPLADWGWAEMIQPFLAYVIAAPTGDHLSFDARRAGRHETDPATWTMPAWPLRLLQVHVCLMYAVSSWARLDDPGWLRGQTVFIAVVNVLHSKLVIDWHPWKPLLAALTYATFAVESLAPFVLWLPGVGTACAYALIVLHLGLEALTHVGWWNFVMIGGLLAFLPPSHLAALLRRTGLVGRARA